ncbi:hypothetical protein [Vibrio navarrensis]|uniref:hypothetical protein n=1 Tax=Vibrio navarrensis TaxID=29495 RepID=UPI0018DC92F2|nr:hypothetical protein [Vibrio navarrensis]
MKKALLALATSAALVGCGGGGSGSGASSQDTTYKKDGIYVNNTDLVVMLVDSDLPLGSVLIGDYVNNEFLVKISTVYRCKKPQACHVDLGIPV